MAKHFLDDVAVSKQTPRVLAFQNGRFLPADQATVSVFDRGFLYGDGLFETTLVQLGRPNFWSRHLARLRLGAAYLQIPLPYTDAEITNFTAELIAKNNRSEAVLRLNLSRGSGSRGYSIQGCTDPTFVMSLHPTPIDNHSTTGVRVITSTQRLLAGTPLSSFKTNNKLQYILARSEAEAAGADDAILLNTRDETTEATASNLFWIDNQTVCTPTLSSGAIDGITRRIVLELCAELGIATRETSTRQLADSAFLTNSVQGIVEIRSIDNRPLPQLPLCSQIRQAYQELTQQQPNSCP